MINDKKFEADTATYVEDYATIKAELKAFPLKKPAGKHTHKRL
jgi:hypothetical protein